MASSSVGQILGSRAMPSCERAREEIVGVAIEALGSMEDNGKADVIAGPTAGAAEAVGPAAAGGCAGVVAVEGEECEEWMGDDGCGWGR